MSDETKEKIVFNQVMLKGYARQLETRAGCEDTE